MGGFDELFKLEKGQEIWEDLWDIANHHGPIDVLALMPFFIAQIFRDTAPNERMARDTLNVLISMIELTSSTCISEKFEGTENTMQ